MMEGIRAWVFEHLSALLDFGKASDSSSGANNSVELDVEVDVDEDGETEGFETAEIWDSPAVLWRPSDPDASGHCETLVMRTGDEIVILAGKDRRWQISLAKGEVVVRGLASGSGYIKFKTDGTIEAGSSSLDFVALAAKVDGIISAMHGVFNTWTPMPNDGGEALQVAWKAAFGTPPSSNSVASANFKAEG